MYEYRGHYCTIATQDSGTQQFDTVLYIETREALCLNPVSVMTYMIIMIQIYNDLLSYICTVGGS